MTRKQAKAISRNNAYNAIIEVKKARETELATLTGDDRITEQANRQSYEAVRAAAVNHVTITETNGESSERVITKNNRGFYDPKPIVYKVTEGKWQCRQGAIHVINVRCGCAPLQTRMPSSHE